MSFVESRSPWLLGRKAFWSLVLLTPVLSWAGAPRQESLTPQQRLGKQIYLRGEGSVGTPVTARLGQASVDIPASVLPCGNCHGHDGKGRPEGGVVPSDVRWRTLSRPYAQMRSNGRKHPPYSERSLRDAIAAGIDPAGSPFNQAMPRYQMSIDDMQALIAYLKVLGLEQDPGLTADRLRIGTLLPARPELRLIAQAIRGVLEAFFADLNRSGGLYGRRFELVVGELPSDPAEIVGAVSRFLEEEQVFALVGAYAAEIEEQIAAVTLEKEIPLVGPFTLLPELGFPLHRHVYYLYPGLATQASTLVQHWRQETIGDLPPLRILRPEGNGKLSQVALQVRDAAREGGWEGVEAISFAPSPEDALELASRLALGKVGAVVFLGDSEEGQRFLSAAHKIGWHPLLGASGPLCGEALLRAPAAFQGKATLFFPSLFQGSLPHVRPGLEQLGLQLPEGPLPAAQVSTLAAGRVLLEGLKRAGRELSRVGLVESLEGLYQFQTQASPLISYGPNRREGARGAYLVSVDVERGQLAPVGPWRELR